MKGFSTDSKSAYEKAGTVSTEAVSGIRTVASFTNEEKLLAMYSERLEVRKREREEKRVDKVEAKIRKRRKKKQEPFH